MDINNYIDLCVINNTHYDISLVVFKILNGKYRYVKNNIWEYLDKNNNWLTDKGQTNLKYSIKTDVYRCFIKRAIEWSNLCEMDGTCGKHELREGDENTMGSNGSNNSNSSNDSNDSNSSNSSNDSNSSNSSNCSNSNLNSNIMFNKMLFISSKLVENKYISSIIKESQQFFI